MKKKYFLCLFLCGIQADNLFAQKITILGDKVFGTMKREINLHIVYIGNGQMLLSTSTRAGIDGDKTEDNCDTSFNTFNLENWIFKINTSFQVMWDRSMGGSGTENSPIIFPGASGDFYFASSSDSDSTCEKGENSRGSHDYWVGTIDSNGNKMWDRTYGGIISELGVQGICLSSGELIVGGRSDSAGIGGDKTVTGYGKSDYWIVKMESSGKKIWDKAYGGTGYEQSSHTNDYDFSLVPQTGSDFLLAGATDSPANGLISDTCRGGDDIWIIRLDSSGTKIWDHRYGGNRDERLGRIVNTPDNGLILAGSTVSDQGLDVSDSSRSTTVVDDIWVVKLDSLGIKQWDKRFGGNNLDVGYWIDNAPNGGYWISGVSFSDSSSEVSEQPFGTGDYWMLKIDSLGNKLFDKRFGGPGYNNNPRFVVLPDSSVFLCGCAQPGTTSIKTDPGYADYDIWCIHFKYEDTLSTSGIIIHSPSGEFATVHPNPANQFFTVKWSLPSTENILFYLYDATGRIVLTRNSIIEEKEMNISIQEIPSGLYFWKVSCKSRYDQNGKIVILR